MRWSYKTVHFELTKEGLLGSAFLDESEVEKSLNEYGKAGWELVSMMDTVDGVIAVFKQPFAFEEKFSFLDDDVPMPAPKPLARTAAEEVAIAVAETADVVEETSDDSDEVIMVAEREMPAEIDEYEVVEDAAPQVERTDDDDIGTIRIE